MADGQSWALVLSVIIIAVCQLIQTLRKGG
jgi:hypothetical protein